MKNNLKINNIAAVFVLTFLTVVLLAVTAGISGCGMINLGDDSADAEDLTFASKNNYEREDILADYAEPNPTGQNNNIINEQIPEDPVNPGEPPENNNNDENQTVPDSIDPVVSESADSSDLSNPINPIVGPIVNPTDLPTEEQNNIKDGTVRVKFIAAGDNIMHSNMLDDAKERAKDGESFNFKDMYKDIKDIIKSADIAMVNVETPIAGDEFAYSGYPMFNTPKENGFALMDMGFNIMNIANNHMLDRWEKGYMNHIEFWENQDVLLIGGFKDEQDFENVRILEKDGISIAFLSYTYGTNGMYLPADSKMVIPYIDAAIIERQVKAAKPLADLLFVAMHWGDEDILTPNQQQRNLAQMMVDNGVDVIIGAHPHVLQETKWVSRPDGGKTLITYSLGNMISGMLGAKNMIGGLLSFDIVKTTKDGESEITLEKAEIIPIMTHYNMRRKAFQVYRFEDYTEDLAKAHGNINSDNKFSYKYIKDLIVNNIAPEFLSDFYKE